MATPAGGGPRQLVGREPQLAVVRAHLADLERPRGSMLLFTGEAGIGKTRLAEEVADLARARGARIVWAPVWPGDGAPALAPWMHVLRELTGDAEALARFAPESRGASAAAQWAQHELLSGAVRTSAREQHLVVVLEDVQWADTATLRLLVTVAGALRDAAVLFVATYRTGELGSAELAEFARVATTVTVPRLGRDDAAAILRVAVGADVTDQAVDAIVLRGGGNPLFVWEFGQLMAESGRHDVAPSAVPQAIAAVLDRRLARLPESTVATLAAGAVAHDLMDAIDLSQISGRAPADVDADLGLAAASGLLRRSEQRGRYRFTHDLVRESLLAGLTRSRLGELHLRTAEVLRARLPARPEVEASVADHLERAGPSHDADASRLWENVARRSSEVLAYDNAAAAYARAARLAVDDARRAALLSDEGEAWLLAGDLARARDRLHACADLARNHGDGELFARAVLDMGTGPVAWEVPIVDAAQAALVTEAITALPTSARGLRSALLARLSIAAAGSEPPGRLRRWARESLELAESVGDDVLVAQALAATNDAFGGPAHATMRRDNADTIITLASSAGRREMQLLGYRFRIVADLELGDLRVVDRDISRFARLAEQLHQPLVAWYVPLFRGMRALLAGDLQAAQRHCADVDAAALTTGSLNAQLLGLTLRVGIDIAAGRPTDPRLFDGLVDLDPADWASLASGMAVVAWHGGERDRAWELVRSHLDDGFSHLAEDSEYLTTLVQFGRIAVGAGDTDVMRAVYDRLVPHSGLWAVDGIAACCWGPVDTELGRLALGLGDALLAREHLGRAAGQLAPFDTPLLRADVDRLASACPSDGDADRRVAATSTAGSAGTGTFRLEGQVWTLGYGGRTARMRDAKGLHDLAALLAVPGREVHVLDLVGVPSSERRALAESGGVGELLDARARAEYRARVAELEDEIGEAEQRADVGRTDALRRERDFIVAELSSALGLGGRPRRVGDPVERARKAVAGRIRLTIGRIDSVLPELAHHLQHSVRTGTFCAYEPEFPVTWVLRSGPSGIATPDVAPPG